MTSTTEIKEELELIKQEDIDILLNQPNDRERMQAEMDKLRLQEEIKKYMQYWKEQQKNDPFLQTLDQIPEPRNLAECLLTPLKLDLLRFEEKIAEEDAKLPADSIYRLIN